MRFGTRNGRSLCRIHSLIIVARELSRYQLDLVGVQEVRWDKGGMVKAGDYICFCGKGNESHQLRTVSFFFFFVPPHSSINS